jgi:uncharacterized protein (DUF736 family)
MAIIGVFTASKAGGWEGRICTLSINLRAKFTPNDNKHSDNSPDFHLNALGCQVGVAWRRRPANPDGRSYLSVQMDDPGLLHPVLAALFPDEGGQTANLVWNPKRGGASYEQ